MYAPTTSTSPTDPLEVGIEPPAPVNPSPLEVGPPAPDGAAGAAPPPSLGLGPYGLSAGPPPPASPPVSAGAGSGAVITCAPGLAGVLGESVTGERGARIDGENGASGASVDGENGASVVGIDGDGANRMGASRAGLSAGMSGIADARGTEAEYDTGAEYGIARAVAGAIPNPRRPPRSMSSSRSANAR